MLAWKCKREISISAPSDVTRPANQLSFAIETAELAARSRKGGFKFYPKVIGEQLRCNTSVLSGYPRRSGA